MDSAPAVMGAKGSSKGRAFRRAALGISAATTMILGSLTCVDVALGKGSSPGAHKGAASPYDVTTYFAIANAENPVYKGPSTHSAVLRKLAFYTPDGEALQTYRLIASKHVHGALWEEIDVPMRPNGQVGWVRRSWLGAAQVAHTLIVVDTEHEQMTVYSKGAVIFQAPVGTGNLAAGWATPHGQFWIAEAFPSNDPVYGPWAFGTTDYATNTDFPDGSIVGIHGTDAPQLIPGDPSHGCIRLKDEDILKLKPLVGIGTPVWIT